MNIFEICLNKYDCGQNLVMKEIVADKYITTDHCYMFYNNNGDIIAQFNCDYVLYVIKLEEG